MRISWTLALAAPFLLLSACEEEASAPVSTETGGEAAGEILGGTISDDMISLEELTSTSPPAERTPSAPTRAAPATEGRDTGPEVQEPTGPVTAGPARPEPQTEEAGEPAIDPPAF